MNDLLKRLAIFPVQLYRWFISPLMPPRCRFQPTCSQYMIEAIQEWGVLRGIWMGMKRIGKCHPWHEGGFDPVPKRDNFS